MKVSLVRAFHWSLPEIAATDMESLFGFMEAYSDETASGQAPRSDSARGYSGKKKVFCDQVSWL
jgi:hypothetical protein